jgi:hypothetical protein
MSEHEHGADPKESPVIRPEVEEDEAYDPPVNVQGVSEAMDIQIRLNAAELATRIPFNATEAITDALITSRLQLMYNWLKTGADKDLADNT